MAAGMLRCLNSVLKNVDNVLYILLGRPFPPGNVCLEVIGNAPVLPTTSHFLKDILDNGFLWAVPKSRRTIEKRWKRLYGNPYYKQKLILPKKGLLVCNTCGHHFEAGILCPHCYKKVADETNEMKNQIQSELGLSPVEKDIVVLYAGEKEQQPKEFWKGKRIIEMKKERPPWFSKNLLQRTTQAPATSSDVKPTELA